MGVGAGGVGTGGAGAGALGFAQEVNTSIVRMAIKTGHEYRVITIPPSQSHSQLRITDRLP